MAIRVMLVDDHRMLREALRSVLEREPDIEIVGDAGDGATALQLLRQVEADVVVLDIAMPDLNGVETTARIAARHPDVRVVALSAHWDKRFVLEMIKAGAAGYVVKASAGTELLRAIRSVARNQKYLCPEVAAVLLTDLQQREGLQGQPRSGLGRREREVLQLLAEGERSPEIATRLSISVSTVEAHRRNIMRKLNLHTIAELTKYAIREGLTSL